MTTDWLDQADQLIAEHEADPDGDGWLGWGGDAARWRPDRLDHDDAPQPAVLHVIDVYFDRLTDVWRARLDTDPERRSNHWTPPAVDVQADRPYAGLQAFGLAMQHAASRMTAATDAMRAFLQTVHGSATVWQYGLRRRPRTSAERRIDTQLRRRTRRAARRVRRARQQHDRP